MFSSYLPLLLLLLLIIIIIILPSSSSSSTHQPSVNSIFILAGQSNMAGRGGVAGDRWDRLVPPESQPNPSVLRLSSRLTWEEARDPLHADIDVNKTCGVGPGLPFANAVRAVDPTLGVVGLVPCAVGGTTIAEWARGGKLYDQMVRRAGAAVREGGGGVVRAVLWYQGESDTVSQADAESYRGNLEKLFSNFRDDLNSPALPIIQVAIASGMGPLVGTVREAQMEVRVPMVWTVDGMGLHLEADGLHLTTDAQVQLGKMLAQAFVKTTLQSPSPVVRYNIAAPNHKPFYGGGWVFGHLLLSAFVGIWCQMTVS